MKKTRDHKSLPKIRTLKLRRVRRITAGLVHHRAPTFSGDGRFVASRLGEGPDSYWVVVDRKGRVARVLEGPAEGGASFAPDGSLAYGRQVGATTEIWQLPSLSALGAMVGAGCGGAAEGAAPRRMLGGDGRLYCDPAYSPDGRFLCYTADDGQDGVARKLWLYDLLQDEHKILVSALDKGEALIRHPAWSPRGDCVYFEASVSDGSAIYVWHLGTSAVDCLTEPGYRRPAPLGDGLVLGERVLAASSANDESELVLIDHRRHSRPGHRNAPTGEDVQILELIAQGARDPAVVLRRKTMLLAWAMPGRAAPQEPSRFDLHIAELDGLPAPARSEEASSASPSADDHGTGEHSAAPHAATHGQRIPEYASVWLDRPLALQSSDADEESFLP